nr:unnamed protein product [Callosobruchus chinensis]
MGASTVGKIIKEVCAALWEVFQPLHMKQPTTADFLRISEEYNRLWDFPNCIGALDGKHIRIKYPSHSGSMFFNYKHYFSIVLQGLVDDHYRFISIDVGGYGKQSDGATFQASKLSKLLEKNKLGIPKEKKLPNFNHKLPHVFIADEAYPLKENLMKPYSGKTLNPSQENFNKRLSRARKTVECAFGIMSSVFRVLRKPLLLEPEPAIQVVMACIVLHNFLRKSRCSSHIYNPPGTFDVYDGDDLIVPGTWRNDVTYNPALRNIPTIPRRSPRTPVDIRNAYANYFYR